MKKLINIWSSRGLSIHGKVTVIKSLLIPKFVYISSLLPTPKELVKDLNRLLFKFLWKGTDKGRVRLGYSGIRIYSGIYSGYSAPGSRMAGMEIQLFRNENSS